jgi:V8-like Glu-specific endopeptidase
VEGTRHAELLTCDGSDTQWSLCFSPLDYFRRVVMPYHANRLRPLTRAELEVLSPLKATRENLRVTAKSIWSTTYVTVPPGVELAPKVKSERVDVRPDGQSLWKIGVEMSAGSTPGLPMGCTVQRHEKTDTMGQISGHPSFRPEWMDVRFIPKTGIRRPQPQMRDGKGRKVRPLTVFPGDARQVLFDTSWPWLLTGKIVTSDGTSGSGVLIGDRLVLTARHVMPWNSIGTGNWWMKFTPYYFDGTEPFGSSYVSDARHYGTDDTDFNLSHDYAVLRLYEPLGNRLGYIGTTSFDDGWRGLNVWENVGYPFDVAGGERPAVQSWQSFEDDYEDDDGQTLETEASLNHGNSGGPFFAWFENGSQVRACGVVSSEVSFDGDADNSVSGGDNLVNLVDWARANWPL